MELFSILAAVSAPKSLWVTLINWIQGAVGNFGWTIILVTLLVKFVTTPLDFAVKLSTKKQTLVQQKCGPQIAKLQKKFGNDKQALQAQTSAIYKREGLNLGAGCAIMLINVILSFTIFISFYNALRKVSAYEAINQYEQVNDAYVNSYYSSLISYDENDVIVDIDTANAWVSEFETARVFIENPDVDTDSAEYVQNKAIYDTRLPLAQKATDDASASAVEKWNNIKKSSKWLWVQNIWVADSTARPFPSYSALKSIAANSGYTGYVVDNINEDNYNRLAGLLDANASRTNNGFYILAVLAGLITFASQYITELHNKLKSKNANKVAKATNATNSQSMKMMKIIMPLIMVIFVLSASASFGLYILASNVSGILFGELTGLIVDQMTKKQRLEVEEALEKQAEKMIKKGQIKE